MMNNKRMALWGFIIVLMCGLILYRGYQLQDKDLSKLQFKLRIATRKYISSENIDMKINESKVVFIDELIDKKYIDYSKTIDEYCLKSIVFTKGIIVNKYKLNKNCKKVDLN